MNKLIIVVWLFVGVFIITSGCITQVPEDGSQDSASDMTQHPEITVEAEVRSITKDNQAVNRYVNSSRPVFVHLATVKIRNLTVNNPTDAWLPSDLSEGNNVTLLFERSTDPAKIIYSDMDGQQSVTNSNHSTQSSSTNSSAKQYKLQSSPEMESVEKYKNQWVFTISSPPTTGGNITLSGLNRGDRFHAELKYGRPMSVTIYEKD